MLATCSACSARFKPTNAKHHEGDWSVWYSLSVCLDQCAWQQAACATPTHTVQVQSLQACWPGSLLHMVMHTQHTHTHSRVHKFS